MGQYRMGPPEALILALQRRVQAADFIETGTYRGDTAGWAAGHFERVTTVEFSSAYHAAAQARFRGQPKVRTLHGNSASVLREVVPGLAGPAIFWLDAHWSGLDTAGQEAECPLLEEIALINAVSREHVLLVDDARLFCAPPPRPHRAEQWPDLAATTAALHAGGRRHVILFEDVFVAVPVAEREFLNAWLQDAPLTPAAGGRLSRWWKKIRA
jgi:hypothetical protein